MPHRRATHLERPEDVKSNYRYHEVSRSIKTGLPPEAGKLLRQAAGGT